MLEFFASIGTTHHMLTAHNVDMLYIFALALVTMAGIFESGITLVHPYSRNKPDFTDLIFSSYVLQAIVTS